MLKTNYNIANQNNLHIDSGMDANVQSAATAQPEKAATMPLQPQYQSSFRMPSRLGEQGAATNMLKAQMLSSTATAPSVSNGDVRTFSPAGGDNGAPHTIYINGINGTPDSSAGEAQSIANSTGTSVDDVYNQSTISNVSLEESLLLAARTALFGFGGDSISKIRADLKNELQNPAAATSAANDIISQLGTPDNTNDVHLVGYSQGAAISSEALNMVSQQLTSQYGAAVANQMLSHVHVLTLGGAASRTDFPASVDLTQVYHQKDPVAQFFGDNKTPIWEDITNGTNILKPHQYFNDPAALNVIAQWQQGGISNQDVTLPDVN